MTAGPRPDWAPRPKPAREFPNGARSRVASRPPAKPNRARRSSRPPPHPTPPTRPATVPIRARPAREADPKAVAGRGRAARARARRRRRRPTDPAPEENSTAGGPPGNVPAAADNRLRPALRPSRGRAGPISRPPVGRVTGRRAAEPSPPASRARRDRRAESGGRRTGCKHRLLGGGGRPAGRPAGIIATGSSAGEARAAIRDHPPADGHKAYNSLYPFF